MRVELPSFSEGRRGLGGKRARNADVVFRLFSGPSADRGNTITVRICPAPK
jgi:hypothetical protein